MKITKEALVALFNSATPEAIKSLFALANEKSSKQGAAADLTEIVWVAEYDGEIDELVAIAETLAAAGESMTIDVQKNGATVLTATTAFVAGGTDKLVTLLLDKEKKSFKKGDVFTVIRDYTAGGGPTPMKNTTVFFRPTFAGV